MAQSYKQIQKQIAQLQKRADAMRDEEIQGVVDRIKVAIAHYGLTAAHLGLAAGIGRGKSKATIKSSRKSKVMSSAEFSDDSGNVWLGRGPRPHWLRDALNAGRSIEEFRVGVTPTASVPVPMPSETAKAASKAPAKNPSARRPRSTTTMVPGTHGPVAARGPGGSKPRWRAASRSKTSQNRGEARSTHAATRCATVSSAAPFA